MTDKPRKTRTRRTGEGLELTALGLMFPIAIGLGFGWGWVMDRFFGTSPWLTAIFTGFGIIASFVNLFRMTRAFDDASGDTDDAD